MSELTYTVGVTFITPALAKEWIAWLDGGHIADVMAGGATSAEIVQLDEPPLAYEVRYRFPSRTAFERYLAEHAPRLRAEGLARFPVEKGVTYRRSVGVIRNQFSAGEAGRE
jgi:hypothetical protein